MHLKYATGFSVDYFRDYTLVTLSDPWKPNSILANYYLVKSVKIRIPKDGIRIQIPIQSLATSSCTHYTFLQMLGSLSAVKGICNVKLVYNDYLRAASKKGSVVDLGDPFQINVEKCLMLKPQVMMVTGYNQHDENISRLSEAGVNVVYNNEWMEANLLARAEWIRYMAVFFDKEALAESLFNQVETNYMRLKNLASKAKTPKPIVLSGDNFRGTWYLPGGRSFTAQLFADAGADYIYKKDTTTGSIPYSFEQVLRDLNGADVWVGATNASSLSELLKVDERYKLFKPFRTGAVYAYSNRITSDGGNDFWESAVAKPDILLADFIKLFHPELLPEHNWFYLNKMN